jgi:major membrane immunogen (membrane-anchored lipoprotein)
MVAALIVMAAAPAITMASVSIESSPPAETNNPEPTFSGSADDTLDPVILKVFPEGSTEAIREVASEAPRGGRGWSVQVESALPEGEYSAVAGQTELLGLGEQVFSAGVTFFVDVTKPKVSIHSVTSPTKDPTPTLKGSRGTATGDEATVTVKIHSGGSGGPVEEEGTATNSGGEWSFTPSSGLADGTYTAQAEQKDEAGNAGKSEGATFVVDTTAPTVTLDEVPSPTKDPTPTLKGSAGEEPGDESSVAVTIYEGSGVGGHVVASHTASASSGKWSYTPSALEDGTYTARATQKDIAGNEGLSTPVTFTIETSEPEVSVSSLSSPTNDSTPTLSGTGGTVGSDQPFVTVRVYHGTGTGGGVASSGTAALSGGKWSYTPSTLEDGTYTAQAEQSDEAHNAGKSNTVTFIVDTKAPAVTMNSVKTPSNNASPTLSGAAGTAPGDHSTVSVTIYRGSSVGGPEAAAGSVSVSSGKWSFSSPQLNDGTYTAQATQRDSASNEGESNPVTFTVETSTPAVTLNPVGSPTNDDTPTLAGSAGTAGTDEPFVTVTIYHGSGTGGGVATSGTVSVSSGKWSFTSAHLGDGTYTAQAGQSDEAGNTGESTTATFIVDTTRPSVSINSVSSPTSATPTLRGHAGTATGDNETVFVTIYRGTSVGSSVAASNNVLALGGEWTYSPPTLEDGTYTAQVEQRDEAGNTGVSGAVTFTVDATPPSVSIEAVPTPSKDTTPTLEGGAGTATGDNPSVKVTIYRGSSPGGTVETSQTVGVSGGRWSFTSPSLPDGTYTAQAAQTDTAGNTGKSGGVTFVVDTTPPKVTLNSVLTPTNDSTPTLEGSAGTAGGDSPNVTVTIYRGSATGGEIQASQTVSESGGKWSYTPSPLPDGTYTGQATQGDTAGDTGTSGGSTFIVDTIAPTPSVNAVQTPGNNAEPTLSGPAGTASGDSPSVSVTIYHETLGGSVASSGTVSRSGGTWSFKSSHLSDGTYVARATQKDAAGNEGVSNTVTFLVETASPRVKLNSPALVSNNTTPSFTGTASDSTGVTVKIYKGPTVTGSPVSEAAASVPVGETWTSGNAAPALGDGQYTAQATQTSSLGNPPGLSNAVTFTVNTKAPTVTLNPIPSPSSNRTPAFGGTASETNNVTVKVYSGAVATGTPVAEVSAPVSSGSWTSSVIPALGKDGSYTATATQKSSISGNPDGVSAPFTFVLDTTAPKPVVKAPVTPSSNTTPSFTGTTDDPATVTVNIYAGATAAGTPVSTATEASRLGSEWSTGKALTALADGQYTAQAVQTDLAGNTGASGTVPFNVDTTPPKVTLNAIKSPWNNKTPSFAGTANDGGEADTYPLTVNIYAGETATGTPIAKATGLAPVGEAWTSGTATPTLADGTYTAQALQTDKAGNVGGSGPVKFVVVTTAPTVTLAALPARGNNPAPSFTGLAGDTTPVTVNIYAGGKAEGTPTSKAIAPAPVAGGWTSAAAGPALKDGQYTAQAIEPSSITGNPAGLSETVTFTVDTTPPSVHITSPPSGSEPKVSRPTFSGSSGTTVGDIQSVTLNIFTGATATGTPTQTVTLVPSGGKWTTGSSGPQLPDGTYTAQADQADDLGNLAASSSTFTVKTNAPVVTLDASKLAHRGTRLFSDATPSFSGSASAGREEENHVTLNIYSGTSTSGTPMQKVEAPLSGTSWTAGPISALPEGVYTAQAEQLDNSFSPKPGVSAAVTFNVDATAPQVTVISPSNGSSTNSGSQPVSGSAGTAEGDLQAITVQLFAGPTTGGGSPPQQSLAVNAAAGAWSATFGGLTPGTYTVRALQSDDASNVGASATTTFVVNAPPAAAPAHPGGPTASFGWFPASPRVGESVSLVSSSTDPSSPITAFAWDPTGTGAFATGGSGISTTFTTAGNHLVHLRVADANGLSSVATATIPVAPPALPLMQPFPIVRITSTGTRSGVRLKQLSVLASRGSKITVQCKGRRCPLKTQSHMATASRGRSAFVEFKRFERSLPAGVILEIRISKPGQTGKFTRFTVRRGKVPVRSDACLDGAAVRPVTCPSS